MELRLTPTELEPIVRKVVAEAIVELERQRATVGNRLAYTEPEAADLLGLRPHQLRDERLRGRIEHTRVVGGRVRYTRDHLLRYLMREEEG
jgi:hypothetical protein